MHLDTFHSYRTAAGKEAETLRNRIVKEELPFVRRCVSYLRVRDSDKEDAVQGGCLGLLKALDKWDPTRGAWVCFARQWILAEAQKIVPSSCVVRFDAKMHAPLNFAQRRLQASIYAEHGTEATAEQLGATEEEMQRSRWREEAYLTWEWFEDMLPGKFDDRHDALDLSKIVEEALDERQRRIVQAYFIEGKTFGEIAEEENLSSAYVYALQQQAIEKMKNFFEEDRYP